MDVSSGSDGLLPGYSLNESGEVQVNITRKDLRWKLAGGKLPLYERHLRSLVAFGFPSPVCSWIRTRLEWSLENQTVDNPEGIVHIHVDDADNVDVLIEPARDISELTSAECVSWEVYSGASPDADGGVVLVPGEEPVDAASTLLRDLAVTLHMKVCAAGTDVAGEATELFSTSDEFGFLPGEMTGPVSKKMADCFESLWEKAREDD